MYPKEAIGQEQNRDVRLSIVYDPSKLKSNQITIYIKFIKWVTVILYDQILNI